MIRHPITLKWIASFFLLAVVLQAQPASADGSKLVIAGAGNETRPYTGINEEEAAPDRSIGEPKETIVVTFNDKQVQSLIKALNKQPDQTSAAEPEEKIGALACFIKKIRYIVNTFQWRVHNLKSGMTSKI